MLITPKITCSPSEKHCPYYENCALNAKFGDLTTEELDALNTNECFSPRVTVFIDIHRSVYVANCETFNHKHLLDSLYDKYEQEKKAAEGSREDD